MSVLIIFPSFIHPPRHRAVPPQPKFEPFAFYSCFRLGDPEQAKIVMATDPYFWTQDNGAGGPIHFATTYKQIGAFLFFPRERLRHWM